VEIPRVPVGPL